MFPYFGSKRTLIKYYPRPEYETIIEPFAGSAAYSFFFNPEKGIINERSKDVYELWLYLYDHARSGKKVDLSAPNMQDDLEKLGYEGAERFLMSLLCNPGICTPRKRVSRFFSKKQFYESLRKVNQNIHKIKNFYIENRDYRELDNIEATWFIDPPYKGLNYYSNTGGQLDYQELAQWCKSRKGQVIVCESALAKWLPFERLTIDNKNKYPEGIWTNRPISHQKTLL